MAIKIKEEKKVKNGKKWLHLVKVCNDGKTDKKVVVTSWPYDANGAKIGKQKNRPELTRTIKAGKCDWFVFEFSTEPKKSYTDVYDADLYDPEKQTGGMLDYTVNQTINAIKLAMSPSRDGNYLIKTELPYPNRFAYTEEPMEFYLESVSGVPADWQYEMLYPQLGETFTLQPFDREFPAILRLKAPQNMEEGTVLTVRIVQRINGMNNEPCYVMRHNLVLAVDETGPEVASEYISQPEEGTIQVQAKAEDLVTGVKEVLARYSLNGGNTWSEHQLTAPLEAYLQDGPNPTQFSGEIGPFRENESVLIQVTAMDDVGNISQTEPVALSLSKTAPSRLDPNNPC